MRIDILKFFTAKTSRLKSGAGFTIMEIIVATTIFAVVSTALLSLFNYTLKINRRSEALRQATQGMRNLVEFLVKEIRNGQIDYAINGGTVARGFAVGACGNGVLGTDYYSAKDNRLGILTQSGDEECVFLADDQSAYAGNGVFSGNAVSGRPVKNLIFQKNGISAQLLNPPNFSIADLVFFIRPLCDPYTASCASYGSSYAKIQPFVTMTIRFVVKLPTGEQVTVNYQTSVSTNNYDIPNQ